MQPAIAPHYRSLSAPKVLRHGSRGERSAVFGAWTLLLLASVALGVVTVARQWSGLPIEFGGLTIYITVYPPLLICLWLTLTCGWLWGAIPAYVSTLTLALYAGMPLPWALLFACADPLGFAVMTGGYRAIAARRDLRDLSSLLFFVQLSFVASIFSSSGALIWCYTNRVDRTELLAIWQGWWLGSFVQSVLIVGPLMALCWPAIERWQSRRLLLLDVAGTDTRRSVLRLLGAVTAGVLIYGAVTLELAGDQLGRALVEGPAAMGHAVAVMRQTASAFFWVFALILLFNAFFGYQLFMSWQRSTDELLAELHQANEALEKLATTDGLTGLLNRRAAEDRLRDEWHRAMRLGQGGAIIMLDIDRFKEINDRHGHPAGDAVIRRLADAIEAEKRHMDVASRYGGEEFLVILPQADAQGARLLAERLRERVARDVAPPGGDDIRFTVSLGVAVIDPADRSPLAWVERADRALYRAKQAGRNRTVVAG